MSVFTYREACFLGTESSNLQLHAESTSSPPFSSAFWAVSNLPQDFKWEQEVWALSSHVLVLQLSLGNSNILPESLGDSRSFSFSGKGLLNHHSMWKWECRRAFIKMLKFLRETRCCPPCSTMWPCVWMTVTFGGWAYHASPFLASVESPSTHCPLPVGRSHPSLLPLCSH